MKFIIAIIFIFTCFYAFSATHNVTVTSNSFSPSVLNIEAGDTVIFTNSSGTHNVKADNGSFRCSDDCEVSVNDGSGAPSSNSWIAEITFHSVGNFNYFCEVHGGLGGTGMSGVINVAFPSSTTVHTVHSSNFVFTDNDITIEVGDIVNFINDTGNHNILADDESFKCSEGCFRSGMNLATFPTNTNWSVFLPFNQVGDNPYYCEPHGAAGGIGMSGIIRVQAPNEIFSNGFE